MAARFCSQCGQELSSTARFCPNCAAPITGIPITGMGDAASPRIPRPPATPGTPIAAAPINGIGEAAAQKPRKRFSPGMIIALIVLGVIVLALVPVAVLAVLASQHRQASLLVSQPNAPITTPAVTNAPAGPAVTSPPLTNAPNGPASSGPALTNAPTQPPITGPGVTNAPNAPAPALPPDVAAYLTFLKGIEERRVAMNNDVAGAMGMLGTAQGMSAGNGLAGAADDPEGAEDPTKKSKQALNQGYNDYALKWQGLIRDFRATPAPPACQALAALYLTFLSDYTTVITKMQVALLNHNANGLPDLSAVAGVQAQVNTDGGQADTELGNICAHYGVAKPFVIAPEGASPSLLGH